jgi:hypothetical protein
MKALHAPQCIAAASSAVALCWSLSASAQQSVVVTNPNQAPAPAAAPTPTVVTPPPAQPSPVVVTAAPSAPAAEDHHAEVEADTGHYWRPNRALLMTGLILAGAPYIASISVAATSRHPGDDQLWIPVFGPWLDLGARGGCPDGRGCGEEVGNKALLVGDGIFQSVGVLEIAGSFLFPETVRATTIRTSKNGDTWVSFTPARMGAGGYGVSAVGQF